MNNPSFHLIKMILTLDYFIIITTLRVPHQNNPKIINVQHIMDLK